MLTYDQSMRTLLGKKQKPRVFVSFDYDHDKQYKYLLEAWDANRDFEFVFKDQTPGEINSNNIDRIKATLSTKINDATHVLFIVGKYANQLHKDSRFIGFINWINFEAHQGISYKKRLAVIKLDHMCNIPNELSGKTFSCRTDFTEENVIAVLDQA